jgi:ElaB/YqjD/DUF883 family membrane-anchored ribosome-binding protein
MKKGNINTLQSDGFNWQDGKRLESLAAVYQEVRGKIDNSIIWYQKARNSKRTLGANARYLAILLGVAAAAMPTVTEMALKTNETLSWWQRPGIATIIGILVGGLLMLDRFAGGTSGWIRYTMSETALKELRDDLAFGYALEEAQWAGQNEPSVEQAKHALSFLQGIGGKLNQIIRNETELWKTEFQSAIQQADEYAKTQPKKVEEAVGIVKITNPERLAGKWFVSFNDGPEQEGANDSKGFTVSPGAVIVHVRATIKANADGSQTREFKTEAADTLVAGTPKVIPITLPLT